MRMKRKKITIQIILVVQTMENNSANIELREYECFFYCGYRNGTYGFFESLDWSR